MKKLGKITVALIVGAITVSISSEALAYNLIGQRLTQDPYNKYYWSGGVTTNLAGFNAQNSADLAMNAWSQTPNTKIYMFKTTDKVSSIMDFYSAYHDDTNELGWTSFFNGYTAVNPQTTQWTWAEMHINNNGSIDWMHDPSSGKYVDPNGKQQAVLAHEAGHGFGLGHIEWYSWTADRLMLTTPTSYYTYGTKGPTADEVSGVQAIYGKLY